MARSIAPDRQGDPESLICRHCQGPRKRVRGYLFCDGPNRCDNPHLNEVIVQATWEGSP
jgi:hypothetical protein